MITSKKLIEKFLSFENKFHHSKIVKIKWAGIKKPSQNEKVFTVKNQ